MACQIIIRSVNGIVPIGGTLPTRLRVTGLARGCPGGLLLTSNVTGPMPTPAPVTPDDRFLIELPIVGVDCGDPVGLTVSCAADPNCFATHTSEPLACCEVRIVSVDAIVSQGALNPTAIRVTGALYGCASDQITIKIPNVTADRTVAVDPVTGSFNEQLNVTAPALVCDQAILVIAQCANDPNCRDQSRERLNCPQCFRAQVSLTAGPCTGTAPNQVQPVTLTTDISLPAGQIHDFQWDFGDGSQGSVFTIDNSSGTGASIYTQVEPVPHNYPAGTYTAELRILTLSECPPVHLTFTVNCNRCPQMTASVVVGACEPTGPLTGSRPVTYTVTFSPPLGATDTAYASISYGGTNLATGLPSGTAQRTGPGALVHTAYLSPMPGGYTSTVSITVVDAQNIALCLPPPPAIAFSTRPLAAMPGVDVAACLACPSSVQVIARQPAPPLPSPHVELGASVIWPAPGPPPPPNPVSYDWTITLPNGQQATITNGALATVNTMTGWSGPGATSGGAVNISQGGIYGVSVTAKYGISAGLPTDPDTGVTSCNLTTATTFPVAGPPPTCPQITGVQVSTPDCADEAQSKMATLVFTANVQNAGAAIGAYQWDFGDPGSASNVTSTSTPMAQHDYATPGNYVVTVSVGVPTRCPPTNAQATVSVGRCSCPEGQTRDSSGNCVSTNGNGDGDEGLGCMLLRWIGSFLIVLGLFAFIVWLCVSALPPWASWVILGIAIGLVLAGIIVLLIWAAICPIKPCLWGVLLAWQILLGFGLVCLYLTVCCWWLWIVGGGSTVIALIVLGIWIARCRPTFCQVIIELVPVLANVIALIGVVAAIPILRACLNKWVGAVVGLVSAFLVSVLGACAAAGTKTKTGAPMK